MLGGSRGPSYQWMLELLQPLERVYQQVRVLMDENSIVIIASIYQIMLLMD